jgi:hypothetical protein
MKKKGKRRRRKRKMKKKRRRTMTPSDPAAPHFLFSARCQRGSETFIYLVWDNELYVFGYGTLACNNCKFVCV